MTIQNKIDSLKFNVFLKKRPQDESFGIDWIADINGHKIAYSVGLGNYFNFKRGYKTEYTKKIANILNNLKSHDNIITIPSEGDIEYNSMLNEFELNNITPKEDTKIKRNHAFIYSIDFKKPKINDILNSLVLDAGIAINYNIDDFFIEFYGHDSGVKLSKVIKNYESCQHNLKIVLQLGFNVNELQEYLQSLDN